MLDGDEAGRLGEATIVATLASHMPVVAITVDAGKQPDQPSAAEIRQLVGAHGASIDQPRSIT
jgi:hypothetical protein